MFIYRQNGPMVHLNYEKQKQKLREVNNYICEIEASGSYAVHKAAKPRDIFSFFFPDRASCIIINHQRAEHWLDHHHCKYIRNRGSLMIQTI